ncbi:hypothetical protein B0J13DRAFT_652298 [Dactylonectria estremocensis]|uniref:Uncharacterized protein n=1 Tax=Dactylonectria estremocensis TaxID=1079267 RepID=A0A9P9IGA2_9HYPO|nr:hypothetical protein B0J13DRAFT_652298 [Dactylonectria estremocensis]
MWSTWLCSVVGPSLADVVFLSLSEIADRTRIAVYQSSGFLHAFADSSSPGPSSSKTQPDHSVTAIFTSNISSFPSSSSANPVSSRISSSPLIHHTRKHASPVHMDWNRRRFPNSRFAANDSNVCLFWVTLGQRLKPVYPLPVRLLDCLTLFGIRALYDLTGSPEPATSASLPLGIAPNSEESRFTTLRPLPVQEIRLTGAAPETS